MFSSIFLGLIISILIITMSLFLGRYIQNKFKILVDNIYLSFSIGFLVYIAIIDIAFMPVMIFALSGTTLLAVWWVVNISLIIFLILKWKSFELKKINYKQFYTLIIGAILIMIISVYIGELPKSGDQIFYVPWVKGNQYTKHLNDILNKPDYSSSSWIYKGQGWYYFQTVVLRTTGMDQNFMNLWVFGSFLGFLMSSVMSGFIYTMIKKTNTFIMFGGFAISIAAQTFVNLGDYPNMGLMVCMWIVILLFILAIHLIKTNKINLCILFAIISFAGWATLSSAIFIIGTLYISILFVMLFNKNKILMFFLFINLIPFLLMIWILSFTYLQYDRNHNLYIFILLLSISILILPFIIFMILIFKYKLNMFNKWSVNLYSYKCWILGIFLLFIILASIYYWVKHEMDPWLNFGYNKDGLRLYINNKLLSISRYIMYWLYVIFLIIIIIRNIKKSIIHDSFNLFQLITAFVILFFFNPIVASFWGIKIIPNIVYYRMAFVTLVPLYISTIIFISKIKFKYCQNIIYMSFVVGLASSIFIPFISRPFMRKNYSSYTGYPKGLPEVGLYISKHYKNKKITGDIDGIWAYADNKFSFPRYSYLFDNLNYSILTDNFYNSLKNIKENQSKIDILIKVKDDINMKKWTPISHGFNVTKEFSNYFIYVK